MSLVVLMTGSNVRTGLNNSSAQTTGVQLLLNLHIQAAKHVTRSENEILIPWILSGLPQFYCSGNMPSIFTILTHCYPK